MRGKHTRRLADVSCYCKMTSVMVLDDVMSFLRLKDLTNTCKRMRHSLTIGDISSVQWWKVGRSWRLQMSFRHLLWVRIEIDQLRCRNGWVIIICLLVSCTKIDHFSCMLVIWSSSPLTSKQWIITQQFTARADLFLNYWHSLFSRKSGFKKINRQEISMQNYPIGKKLTFMTKVFWIVIGKASIETGARPDCLIGSNLICVCTVSMQVKSNL